MHTKTHEVSRLFAFPRHGRNIHLIFVSALMQHCTLSITWKFLQFPAEKGSAYARLEVGVALQHRWLSSAWSALWCWMRAKGSNPAGQLRTCPAWDGAGSKAHKMTAHSGVPQPGTHTQAIAIGKTSKQLKKTQCITHVLLDKQQTSNLPNTLGVKQEQNNSAIQYISTLVVISSESHIQLQTLPPTPPCFPPLLHALNTDGRSSYAMVFIHRL